MERTLHDQELTPDEINEMEERRIDELNKAGIDESDVLARALEDNNLWTGYFHENITRGEDDFNFLIRDQWTPVERSEFSRLQKPAMTFNKLYDQTKKIEGEQRKNKPDLLVRSRNAIADQDEINLRADLVRSIAYHSQTNLVYQTAFRCALNMGFGAFQILIDYESPRSFNKMIRYGLIADPTLCSWDPVATMPHKGDGNFCSRRFAMSRQEFFATYPYVTNPVSYTDPYMLLDFTAQTRDIIMVCDQYRKEWYPLLIYKLNDGSTVTEDEWKEREKNFEDNMEYVQGSVVGEIIKREIPKIVAKRQTQDYDLMHYRLIQNQILDFSYWPGKQLPIPFVDGDSYWIKGQQYTKSFIHEARDAQKCINFFGSEIAAETKNRRREQWLATPENIIGNEQQWRNPEVQMGALIAKPDPKTGQMPQKMPAWEISQGLVQNMQRATQDLREITGFSENEQMQGRDISGKARRERKLEGSMSAQVFFDNLNQAVEQGGRIINELLPYVVGEDERYMNVTRSNGKTEGVILNKKQKGGTVQDMLSKGEFDIEIDTGPSFAVQRDIALEFFQETIAASGDPGLFRLIADLWAENLDIQNRPQVVERFKTMVPPDILAKENGEPPPPPPPPSPQDQMMQLEMKNRQAEIQERAKELSIREEKHQLEKVELMMKAQKLQSDMKMDMVKNHNEMARADMDFSARIAKILADSKKEMAKSESKDSD